MVEVIGIAGALRAAAAASLLGALLFALRSAEPPPARLGAATSAPALAATESARAPIPPDHQEAPRDNT